MSDDAPWHVAADRARQRTIVTSNAARPAQTVDALASEFQRTHGFAGVPPGSIVRPRA